MQKVAELFTCGAIHLGALFGRDLVILGQPLRLALLLGVFAPDKEAAPDAGGKVLQEIGAGADRVEEADLGLGDGRAACLGWTFGEVS